MQAVKCLLLFLLILLAIAGCGKEERQSANAAELRSEKQLLAKDAAGFLSLEVYLLSGTFEPGKSCEIEIVLRNVREDEAVAFHMPVLKARNLHSGLPYIFGQATCDDWFLAYTTPRLWRREKSPHHEMETFHGAYEFQNKEKLEKCFKESGRHLTRYDDKGEEILFLDKKEVLARKVKVTLADEEKGIDVGVFNVEGWWRPETGEQIHKDGKAFRLWFGSLYAKAIVPSKSRDQNFEDDPPKQREK